MPKGITPVISIILLVLITISIVGAAYVFFGRTVQTIGNQTEEQIKHQTALMGTKFTIDGAGGDKIYIRNSGTVTIPSDSLGIYINGEKIDYTTGSDISKGSVGEITLPSTITIGGSDVLKVTAGVYSDEILVTYGAPIPIGYWKFNEGSGTTAADSSANNNHGTLYGDPTWTSGRYGSALDFDGTGDYVDVGNPSILQLTGDMTIAFWAYPTNIAEGRENPIDKAYCGEFALTQETSGSLSYYQGPNGGRTSGYMSRGWGNVFANGQWVHIAIVRNITAQSIRLYKDAVDRGEGGTSWQNPSVSNYPVTIGDGYAGSGFHGIIDDVRIYNRVLNQNEISQVMNNLI